MLPNCITLYRIKTCSHLGCPLNMLVERGRVDEGVTNPQSPADRFTECLRRRIHRTGVYLRADSLLQVWQVTAGEVPFEALEGLE